MITDLVVLDTNILISALIFGGKPRQVLRFILHKKIRGVTSPILIAELSDILAKKFSFSQSKIILLEKKIKKNLIIVYPKVTLHVLKDEPDNRVLETAIEGNANTIVTGDKELLNLRLYKNIQITTSAQFLEMMNTNN